ncbi:hypothetical protein FHW77_003000 [Agrobacterium sp. RC10-4-1]|nr:hypothetical protein [Agrobacterium sp. RC10-4-1]MDP9775925.1 hypothetical protein [Rhizobium sp. SORGH_AS_0755]
MSVHPKPCVSCRFHGDSYCYNMDVAKPDAVSGFSYRMCYEARLKGRPCGPDGAHFEPRKTLLQRIKGAFKSDAS